MSRTCPHGKWSKFGPVPRPAGGAISILKRLGWEQSHTVHADWYMENGGMVVAVAVMSVMVEGDGVMEPEIKSAKCPCNQRIC